jgi:hypothetical protein
MFKTFILFHNPAHIAYRSFQACIEALNSTGCAIRRKSMTTAAPLVFHPATIGLTQLSVRLVVTSDEAGLLSNVCGALWTPSK